MAIWFLLLATTLLPVAFQRPSDTPPSVESLVTARLGLTLNEPWPELLHALSLPTLEGGLVTEVIEGGPAERAGLRTGDLILEVDRTRVKRVAEIVKIVRSKPAGAAIGLKVSRQRRTFEVTVRASGAEAPTAPGGIVGPVELLGVPSADSLPLPEPAAPPTDAGTPITLTSVSVEPDRVEPGGRFTLQTSYVAAADLAAMSFSFSITADGRELFASRPEAIDAGAGAAMVHRRTLAASQQPGSYRIVVTLWAAGTTVTKDVTLLVAAPQD